METSLRPRVLCHCTRLLARVALAVLLLCSVAYSAPGDEREMVLARSVGLLTMEDTGGELLGIGACFVVADGVVATTMHLVQGPPRGSVRFIGQEKKRAITGIVASDPAHDLVLLGVEGESPAPLTVGNYGELAAGDAIRVLNSNRGFEDTFLPGTVSAMGGVGEDSVLHMTASISGTCIGGPVVNDSGEVIGVAFATAMERPTLSLAIPSSHLLPLISKQHDLKLLPWQAPSHAGIGKSADQEFWNSVLSGLRQAAERGDPNAMFRLGVMLGRGIGVPQNDDTAAEWFRKSAEAGSAEGMANLAFMYQEGRGVEQDYAAAHGWTRKAADQGYADAVFTLGQMHEAGRGVPKNNQEAVSWYRKAADQEVAEAMLNLGVMYQDGLGVGQDYGKAREWFTKAAEGGNALAKRNLGVMYLKGRGVTQNNKEAMTWFRKAALAGDPDAMLALGAGLMLGRGVAEDPAESYLWFLLAASHGVEHKQALELLADQLTPETRKAARRTVQEVRGTNRTDGQN